MEVFDRDKFPEQTVHAGLGHIFLTAILSHWDFSHGKFGFLSPEESQLQQSCATQPTAYAGCFSVSIIHRTLTWTTGSLTCAQMLMHAIAHKGVYGLRKRESALKVDSGRKLPAAPGNRTCRQRRAGPTLHQLSYIPTLHLQKARRRCSTNQCQTEESYRCLITENPGRAKNRQPLPSEVTSCL